MFPYSAPDELEVVYYHIKWKSNPDSGAQVTYELIRNRRFTGYEDFSVLGDNKHCAKFRLEENIISDLDGSIEMKTTGVEYYASDIGLVFRRRQVHDELIIEQKLLAIITSEEFDSLKIQKN